MECRGGESAGAWCWWVRIYDLGKDVEGFAEHWVLFKARDLRALCALWLQLRRL